MTQETGKENNPLKEGTLDVINLANQLQHQERSMTWDYGILAAGITGGYLASNLSTEPGSISRAIIWLGPSIIVAVSMVTGFVRRERIANIRGQMEGITRQAMRTHSLQDHPTETA